MTKPVIYVFLNKSLHMSVGKAVAQAAHAVAMAIVAASDKSQRVEWIESPHRYIIVLEARDEDHLHNIHPYLSERGIAAQEIYDEGANEIDPITFTALATEILDKDDEKVQLTMSTFNTYRDDIRVTLEIPR